MSEPRIRALLDAATAPYRAAGHGHYHFARGKIGRDPAFFELLRHGLIPDSARVLDLGCGQFLIAALIVAARRLFEQGNWPAGWADAPVPGTFHGIELRANVVRAGRDALGERITLEQGDICAADYPPSDLVMVLDVLHYLSAADQELVLGKITRALGDEGRLLLRVGDAAAGWSFTVTRIVDQLITMARGALWPTFHCRPIAEWTAMLERLGFRVRAAPMSQGTPFANVLLIADRG